MFRQRRLTATAIAFLPFISEISVALLEFCRINEGGAKRIRKSPISHKFVHYLPSQPRIVVQVIVILMQVGLTQVELRKRFGS